MRTRPSLDQHRYTGETTDMPSNILPAKLTDRMTNIKESKRKLKIGTLNVQNIRANAAFIQDIMKDIYILLIQEHWLFKFEEKEIEKLLPNIDFYARYIDKDSSINHTERIRGYGGILTIWNEHLTPLIRRLPEDKNNITARDRGETVPDMFDTLLHAL